MRLGCRLRGWQCPQKRQKLREYIWPVDISIERLCSCRDEAARPARQADGLKRAKQRAKAGDALADGMLVGSVARQVSKRSLMRQLAFTRRGCALTADAAAAEGFTGPGADW